MDTLAWAVVTGKAGWADDAQKPKRPKPRNKRAARRVVQAGKGSAEAKAFWNQVLA